MKIFFLLICSFFVCLIIKGIQHEQASLTRMDNELINQEIERKLLLQSKFKKKGNLGRYLKTHYLVHQGVR